jgi:hypothetical protein
VLVAIACMPFVTRGEAGVVMDVMEHRMGRILGFWLVSRVRYQTAKSIIDI